MQSPTRQLMTDGRHTKQYHFVHPRQPLLPHIDQTPTISPTKMSELNSSVVDSLAACSPSTGRAHLRLDTLPIEILEQIAYHCSVTPLMGLPDTLCRLARVSKAIYSRISVSANPMLYTYIFRAKFDVSAARRRLGADRVAALTLVEELKLRCRVIKMLRAQANNSDHANSLSTRQMLWTCYLMTLEDDGLNSKQLLQYGNIHTWLTNYLFTSDKPSSGAIWSELVQEDWFEDSSEHALAMWLLWFYMPETMYNEESQLAKQHIIKRAIFMSLKVGALGAHNYSLSSPEWHLWTPKPSLHPSSPNLNSVISYYGAPINPSVPPLAVPSILAFMAHYAYLVAVHSPHITDTSTPDALQRLRERPKGSTHYDADWRRCMALGSNTGGWTGSYELGCIDGSWEGNYTFMDFAVFAHLLRGSPPSTLYESPLGKHQQTWLLREYVLLSPTPATSGSNSRSVNVGDNNDDNNTPTEQVMPLPPGSPLRAHFPVTALLKERAGNQELSVQETEYAPSMVYVRSASVMAKIASASPGETESREEALRDLNARIKDVIIIGEGHSSWGQFRLVGRIRPLDGLFYLCKDYTSGERGQWLYRGYVVGGKEGKMSGRWRDTMSPPHLNGYEGTFVMGRRK